MVIFECLADRREWLPASSNQTGTLSIRCASRAPLS